MSPEISYGLTVIFLTIIVILLLKLIFSFIWEAQQSLGSWIADYEHAGIGGILLRIPAVLLWIVLAILSIIPFIFAGIGLLAAGNTALKWLKK